mgnify:CR=1 FL=1
MFESFVNSERCKTVALGEMQDFCLRALLIQKDVKLKDIYNEGMTCLRALLIRKDVKPQVHKKQLLLRLRALLIRKDVKPGS